MHMLAGLPSVYESTGPILLRDTFLEFFNVSQAHLGDRSRPACLLYDLQIEWQHCLGLAFHRRGLCERTGLRSCMPACMPRLFSPL
jgi:hypothetical protein